MTDQRRREIENNLRNAVRTNAQADDLEEYINEFRNMNLKLTAINDDEIGNQKTRLVSWIIDNMNEDYQLVSTQRGIAQDARPKLSINVVTRVMNTLTRGRKPFLVSPVRGVYAINPEILDEKE